MLISYSGKKKTKTKTGLFLISMKDELQLSSDQRSKPQPVVYYDYMKGEVDDIDLLAVWFPLDQRINGGLPIQIILFLTQCHQMQGPCIMNATS